MFFSKFAQRVFKERNYSRIYKRFLSSKVKVRFAPSPTGYLHLGGLRTALLNHLFAKSQNGVTIIRIEDTDLSRKVPSAAENLVEDLAWCGITYDEGPYFQSERQEIYKKYLQQLLDQGDAYYCFCTKVRLDLVRREALKARQVPKYDNCCRRWSKEEVEDFLKQGKPACVRFKLSDFTEYIDDLIHGPMTYNVGANEGDPIIFKADGFPTYHFANVVDDHLMDITHVLRGMEWLVSTPKHALLYRAFKWNPPRYAHIPLLMNPDGTKLSKRQGDIHVRHFKESGYFPNSLINFLTRFGGGFNLKAEKNIRLYSLEELVEKFDLSTLKNSPSQVDLQLLPAYNHAEILKMLQTRKGKQELVKKTQEIIQNHFRGSEFENKLQISDDRVEFILEKMKHRILCVKDLVNKDFYYLWVWENKWNESNEIYVDVMKNLFVELKDMNWTQDKLKVFLKEFCNRYTTLKFSEIMQTIRIVLTGQKVGHSVGEILSILSKEDVLLRLSKVLEDNASKGANQN